MTIAPWTRFALDSRVELTPEMSVILGADHSAPALARTLDAFEALGPRPRREVIVPSRRAASASQALLTLHIDADPNLRPIPSDDVPLSAQYNVGASVARADVLMFVRPGAEPDAATMEAIAAAFAADAAAILGFVGAGATGPQPLHPGDLLPGRATRPVGFIAIRRTAWETVGPFDITWTGTQAVGWALRAMAQDLMVLGTAVGGTARPACLPTVTVWEELWARGVALDPALTRSRQTARAEHRRALAVQARHHGQTRLGALACLIQGMTRTPGSVIRDPMAWLTASAEIITDPGTSKPCSAS
ncbi:hypothetical protein F1188_04630 [Roseospira marina]|uniref:Glycosyltransferase family 2 protein n=1 Tax=Roseospira marina TaxID=140057 RepID=A0A5M6IFA9_9PROT|nr:hypothetical protein [Roseospira marina]KAA5606627.1 hypothetical protein F1188_04630 [Roseospira marina]MBB4313969.1 hypothetical protein [Roseospira marina]MBB5087131.1 hypothetical protein [Roseospira marina]